MAANGSVGSPSPGLSHAALPDARMALALLLAINLFNYIDRQMLAAVVPSIKQEYFASGDSLRDFKVGILNTAFMVTYMVLSPVFSWLADRYSRWWLIGSAVAFWSLASAASGMPWPVWTGLALAFPLLLMTRCFVGVGEAAYGPAAPTIIADLYPVQSRGKVLAWFYAAIPVGSALGYVLAGAVQGLIGDWRWAFYLVLPPGLVLAFLCFKMREPTRGQADPGSRTSEHLLKVQDLRGVVRILVRTPSYVLDTLGMTAMTFALGGLGAWMPDYIFRNKLGIADPESLGPAEREQLLAPINLRFGGILAVSGIVATLLGGMVGDWLRRRYAGSYFLVSGISMLLGFPVILLVLYTGYPWYWIFTFLACFCLFFNTGPTNTVLANVTHPAMRARAFGLNIFVLHAFGDAVSPAIIGLISGFSSQEVGFITVSVLVLVGGLLWLWGARYLARDTALAPNRLG